MVHVNWIIWWSKCSWSAKRWLEVHHIELWSTFKSIRKVTMSTPNKVGTPHWALQTKCNYMFAELQVVWGSSLFIPRPSPNPVRSLCFIPSPCFIKSPYSAVCDLYWPNAQWYVKDNVHTVLCMYTCAAVVLQSSTTLHVTDIVWWNYSNY